jgi:hypothetical protein
MSKLGHVAPQDVILCLKKMIIQNEISLQEMQDLIVYLDSVTRESQARGDKSSKAITPSKLPT